MNLPLALTYDDVALVPQYNNIPSRTHPSTKTWLTKDIEVDFPIIPSNMDTVISCDLADVIIERGGIPIFHRFTSFEQQEKWIEKYKDKIFISCGINNIDDTEKLLRIGARGVCIDIAHGHSEMMVNFIRDLKSRCPDKQIIAGNVCTAMGYQDLVNAGADAVKVGIGSGCFVGSTRILMANGTCKNISDISVGNKVINKDGKCVKVLAVINRGFRDTIVVRTGNWYETTIVTPDHRYWIGDCSNTKYSTLQATGIPRIIDRLSKTIPKQSKFKWKEIGEMCPKTMFLLSPRRIRWDIRENFSIDLANWCRRGTVKEQTIHTAGTKNETIFNRFLESSYDLGYIFGLFLGDGCSVLLINSTTNCESGRVDWCLGANEGQIADKLEQCISKLLNYKCHRRLPKGKNVIIVTVYNKCFTRILHEFGKRTEKHLPEKYYASDRDYVTGLFDGLVDSDGHREKYGNTSKYLIELFNWCCMVLGYTFSNQKCKKSFGGLKGIKKKEDLQQPYRASKINTKRFSKNYMYSYLREVEKGKLEEVFDIEVDCPTHSFIANGSIVHNSICSTRNVTGFGVSQFTAIRECAVLAQKLRVPIIADGGIRSSRDVVIALAAGASTVMCGKLFALTKESAAPKKPIGMGEDMIVGYRGQASAQFQNEFYGTVKKGTVPEGINVWEKVTGKAHEVIDDLLGGLRSGMTYGGARNIKELQRKAEFVRCTPSYVVTNREKCSKK